MSPQPRLLALLSGLCAATLLGAGGAAPAFWPPVGPETKPWVRWWWPGSAVDPANLTRELETIAAAGFGGVEITPIYGAKGYEDRFIPFLSPKYVEMLAHTGAEAKRLGLGVDMATGTGWPFGGPSVGPADAELKLAFGPDGQIAPEPTSFRVKRSAPGGEGLVLNPYSAAAMARYLETFSRALAALPPGAIHGQFHDSFEYQANWAAGLPDKFLALHGYDLRDHAAELNGQGPPDTVARVKADYRTTLGALHLDYLRTWVEWAHARGESARNQAHGAPGNLLDLYAVADIPETEIFGSIPFPIPGFRREPAEVGRPGHPPVIHRFASSAAHVMGRPLASSETFTWLREHFHESPSEMKPELDELFLAGINHIYYHGDAYSPADAPWPGWLFYASSQLNPRNPLWRDLGDGLNAYITRAQSFLQAGAPDNDLLVYWPADDLWHNPDGQQIQLTVHAGWLEPTPCGQLMALLTARGFSFDLVSAAQLDLTRVADGRLTTPGQAYRVLLVPRTGHLAVGTLQRLVALARDGATVLFADALPADVPGLGQLEERREKLRATLAGLAFTAPDGRGVRSAQLGKSGGIITGPADALLERLRQLREPLVAAGLSLVRRRWESGANHGSIFFIANQSAQPFDGWGRLRHLPRQTGPRSVELLDPRTGAAGFAALQPDAGGNGAGVYLQLQPGQSVILRTDDRNPALGPAWPYARPAGAALALDGEWRVTAVRGGPELPPSFTQSGPGSWTARGGEWERFGGTARYETEFTLPAGPPADDWRLDLGDVRETARVFVNGREVDLLWSLPLRTNIGRFLQPGRNTLALEITNLAANRIRDLDRRKVEWKKFHEINFVNIFYRPFDAADWPLQPSGLLGAVTLVPLQQFIPQ